MTTTSTQGLHDSPASTNKPRFFRRKPKQALPKPLTRFKDDPVKFALNNVITYGHRVVWTAFGIFVASGVYWLVTQTNQPVHDGWHNLVPNGTKRHYFRAVIEGFFGGLGALYATHNAYKRVGDEANSVERYMNTLSERLGMRNKLYATLVRVGFTVARVAVSFVLLIIFGAIGFAAALWFISTVLHHSLNQPETGVAVFAAHAPKSFGVILEHTGKSLVENWPVKVMGLVAAITGRWAIKGVIDDLQLWFVHRRIWSGTPYGKLKQFFLPTPYLARYNDQKNRSDLSLKEPSKASTYAIWSVQVVFALLAILGFAAINFNLPHVQ